jgi:hypothetical protein
MEDKKVKGSDGSGGGVGVGHGEGEISIQLSRAGWWRWRGGRRIRARGRGVASKIRRAPKGDAKDVARHQAQGVGVKFGLAPAGAVAVRRREEDAVELGEEEVQAAVLDDGPAVAEQLRSRVRRGWRRQRRRGEGGDTRAVAEGRRRRRARQVDGERLQQELPDLEAGVELYLLRGGAERARLIAEGC